MAKKWNPILVTSSIAATTSQESAENRVGVKVALFYNYATDQDSVENIPLEWDPWWHFDLFNRGDDTHEPVINPQVTVKSSLNLINFYPDDPKVFTAQKKLGVYTWNFGGYEFPEYELLHISATEKKDMIRERPRFTVSRTVSPEVLKDITTLQKVTVAFRLEEPLPSEFNHIEIQIGIPQDIRLETSLIEYQLESQNEVNGWTSFSNPPEVSWNTFTASSLEIGRTYTFEATFKATKSNELANSPIFKPDISVFCGTYQDQEQKTNNSITIVYSDFMSATFTADNIVTWIPYTYNPVYALRLNYVLLGVEGEKPPPHAKIDADTFVSPEVLDLAGKVRFTVYIRLPKGYDINDIDLNTISCNGAPAVKGTVFGKDNTAYKAEFNIQDLVGVPVGDAVVLTITGELIDRTHFEGSFTVKIVNT